MIESFVDLTYRGLSLGRRVKLSQVRPSTGYLETPAPMPVGTSILITTDEGVLVEATVTSIHEQVGGSEKTPGMTVAPKLAGEATESWWRARVAYPDEVRPASPTSSPSISRTASQVTVRPRSHTIPEPPPEGVIAARPDPEPAGGRTIAMSAVVPEAVPEAVPEPVSAPQAITDVIPVITATMAPAPAGAAMVPDARATTVMPAIDQELLESLTRKSGEIEQLVRTTGEHEVIDDGRSTTVMDAVDPAALGLDFGGSGTFPAVDDDSNGGTGDDKKPAGGAAKKKRKRR